MTLTVRRPPAATVVSVLALTLLSASSWWVWLAWDDSCYTDPRTGQAAGPYLPWQVIGCVLTLLVVGIAAYVVLRPLVVGVTMTLAFTLAYAFTVVPSDETGLSGVGVVLVLIGMTVATTVTGTVAHLVIEFARSHRGRRPGPGAAPAC